MNPIGLGVDIGPLGQGIGGIAGDALGLPSQGDLTKAGVAGLGLALAVPALVGVAAAKWGGRSAVKGAAIGIAGTLVGGAVAAAVVGAIVAA